MPFLAHLGLGSNLGDRRAILDFALASLDSTPGISIRAISAYLETSPVGGPPGQRPFLNAAAEIATSLDPNILFERLQEIERAAGRVRRVRWGERTLDLDILLFDGLSSRAPGLLIPHPRMPFRRFVLAPLATIAPQAIHPPTRRTIIDLLSNLDRRPSHVALLCDPYNPSLASELASRLALLLPEEDPWTISVRPIVQLSDTRPPSGQDSLDDLPAPTFLVSLGSLSSLSGVMAEHTVASVSEVPILVPESTSPDAILDEIVATCLASRP
jgi:2-amino-4-hydroxy-6-hydroxymethyldihydropteridine diphosphokinase